MEDILIQASGLRKTFHTSKGVEVRAVDGLDLQVRAGEIYGLVGADGAGTAPLGSPGHFCHDVRSKELFVFERLAGDDQMPKVASTTAAMVR